MNRFSLASVEAGKAPVRFGVAWACKEKHHLSLAWLAEGEGHLLGNCAISYPETASPKMLFSNAYKLFVEQSLSYAAEVLHAFPGDAIMAATASKGSELSTTEIDELFGRVSTHVQPQHHAAFKRAMASWATDIARRKTNLTDTETPVKPSAVKPQLQLQLPGLLVRLKKATEATGKKSELAKFLQSVTKEPVPLASVSRWLSGEREPGGEIALLLDSWATSQGFPKGK